MIKIIKKGTRKIIECQSCGCEFSYEEDDILYDKDIEILTNVLAERWYVECPQCKKEVILKQLTPKGK